MDWSAIVEDIIYILEDLDEHGTPKRKMPCCPRCGADELGVIHANLCQCYACNWKLVLATGSRC